MPVSTESRGPVAIVTIDRRDKANALGIDLMGELRASLGDAARSHRGLVLTGAGGVFCGGADLGDLRTDPDGLQAALTALRSAVLDLPVPIVAAVDGPCVGGGVELAMACDLRIGSPSAAFEIPAARLAVAYPEAGLQVLRHRLPHQTLARLFLLNERIDAAGAVVAGIVARLAEDPVDDAIEALGRVEGLDAGTVTDTKHRL